MEIFQLFPSRVKTQYHQQVKIVRIDGESSISTEVLDWLEERGIVVEKNAPYTPTQNGYAERTGRILTTKARALRLNSRLPHNLWPELIHTAVYLLNRTPMRRLGWKTPFEALTRVKPDLKHLAIIGCKYYVLDKTIRRNMKLDRRVVISYLVRYDSRNI